jgi:hypothetical protein
VYEDGAMRAWRVLDVRQDCGPLVKEFAWRAAAAHRDLAGRTCRVNAVPNAADGNGCCLKLEARVGDDGEAKVVAELDVPLSSFASAAWRMVRHLGLRGHITYSAHVLSADSVMVSAWARQTEDSDFEVISGSVPTLTLPDGFSTAPVPAGRVLCAAPRTWLRCAFRELALEEFLSAAAREAVSERAWVGLGHVRLRRDACAAVIEELVELPGASGLAHVVTHGRDWARLHRGVKDRLVAFLHLHPRSLKGQAVAAAPSEDDAAVACNVDVASPRPCVFPIALFGTSRAAPGEDLAAYGFEKGVLRRVQLEVVT